MRRRLCLIESFFRTGGCKARRDSKASTYEKTLFTKLMKSYKPALAGEWFDGLSRGDDTYFMLNLQSHRQCPAGGFYFVRLFSPTFDGSRCRVRLDGGQARTSPVNTSHRGQGVGDLALRSCTARCFSGCVSVDFPGAFDDIFVSSSVCSSIFQE